MIQNFEILHKMQLQSVENYSSYTDERSDIYLTTTKKYSEQFNTQNSILSFSCFFTAPTSGCRYIWCWGAFSITVTCILALTPAATKISAFIKTLHCLLPTDWGRPLTCSSIQLVFTMRFKSRQSTIQRSANHSKYGYTLLACQLTKLWILKSLILLFSQYHTSPCNH